MLLFLVLLALSILWYLVNKAVRSLKVSNLADKYVIVTGCDSGFGNGLVKRLDELGMNVFAACFTSEGLREVSETCSSRVIPFSLDVSKQESIHAALRFVKDKLPADKGLWGLVNNAGIAGVWAPVEMCQPQDYYHVLSVNLVGMVEMTRQFLPLIRKTKGRIVNTASIMGRVAFFAAPYTISKFSVEAFSDCLRRDISFQGVKVALVEPGGFSTPLYNRTKLGDGLHNAFDRSDDEVKKIYGPETRERYLRCHKNLEEGGSREPGMVVDAYTHALTSRYPRKRYIVGRDATYLYLPLSFCPDWLADYVFAQITK